jgi:hypothetical protein
MFNENARLTVGKAIMNVLPTGTIDYLEEEDLEALHTKQSARGAPFNWLLPPVWPTDLFVTAAHIIHGSGLLNYFDPDPDGLPGPMTGPYSFTLTAEERNLCIKIGALWAADPALPDDIYSLWADMIRGKNWDSPLRASSYTHKARGAPKWWKTALKLLIISDEACVGLGTPSTSGEERWLLKSLQGFSNRPFIGVKKLTADAYRAKRQPTTYGIATDPDVACIQPKSRISSVGCNLRNITKNASYLPHAGNLRCHWQQPISSDVREDADTLDILIIPLPFELNEASIRISETSIPHSSKRPNWGNFEIHQDWLKDEEIIVEAILNEVRKAKSILRKNPLNGIVFPEYALTESLFNKICNKVKNIEPNLEFAVSGSSSNCDGENGNFVLTALWKIPEKGDKSRSGRYILTSRRKHHRWKMSPDQVRAYDLERALPPPDSWWETHCIAQREIHLFHFRKTSVFTTMICEDLARSDPCHDILRAIGPNLLFALLMDGPQLASRWPGRYAATLADDPGTSVLTVTSMGLINRSNDTKRFPPNRTIGLWRDETGKTRELALDEGSSSMLLNLRAVKVKDQTLDGRCNENAWSWRYDHHRSL